MIVKIPNCDYCKQGEFYPTNDCVVYIQCYKTIDSSNKDIYEFQTNSSKIYVAARTVIKLVIHDVNNINIDEIITSAISEYDTRMKYIYYCEI